MEKIYLKYKEIAEFRIVYIREAHSADSTQPARFAIEKGIKEHRDYGQRCSIAEMMMEEEKITIPCIIDDIDNRVNNAYMAWPDRIFVVSRNGELAVAAKRGPQGFKPALQETIEWLAQHKESGID